MWKPLGEILVSQGVITEEQLFLALEVQLDSPEVIKLGDVLISMGFVTRDQIKAALAAQQD